MKKNEIIELNGVEYTLELNRDSFLQIDKICDVKKSMEIIKRDLYEHIDEIDDNYDPFANIPSDEDMEKEVKLKEETLHKLVVRAMFIWMYPNHKLTISQVTEILDKELEDKEKASIIFEKVGEYLGKCINIREAHNLEQKNLKALANKN